MTIKGKAMIQVTAYCPDRWSYSFDGTKATLIEEFDECTQETIDLSRQVFGGMGFSFEAEKLGKGYKVAASIETNQMLAIRALFSESVFQAATAGVISNRDAEDIQTMVSRMLSIQAFRTVKIV